MKKILGIFLIAISLLLVSCGKKDTETTTRIDSPSAETVSSLKLESVKNGKTIKAAPTDSEDYYIIKIAEDAKGSLFAHNTALDETIDANKKLMRSINVSPLTFTSSITEEEKAAIMKEVYASETGITKASLGVDFELKSVKKWTVELDCEDIVDAYLNSNQKNNNISKIYLPLYVEHYVKNEVTLKAYVMIPVYYAFTTINDGVNSDATFKDFAVATLSFDSETNLLK